MHLLLRGVLLLCGYLRYHVLQLHECLQREYLHCVHLQLQHEMFQYDLLQLHVYQYLRDVLAPLQQHGQGYLLLLVRYAQYLLVVHLRCSVHYRLAVMMTQYLQKMEEHRYLMCYLQVLQKYLMIQLELAHLRQEQNLDGSGQRLR